MLLIPWTLATEKTLQELLYPPDILGYEKSLICLSLVNGFNIASLRKNWSGQRSQFSYVCFTFKMSNQSVFC